MFDAATICVKRVALFGSPRRVRIKPRFARSRYSRQNVSMVTAPRSSLRFSAGSEPFETSASAILGSLARLFHRQDAIAPKRKPPASAVRVPVLQHKGLSTARLGPEAKAGQFTVPNEIIDSTCSGRVNRTFCQLCHGKGRVSIG